MALELIETKKWAEHCQLTAAEDPGAQFTASFVARRLAGPLLMLLEAGDMGSDWLTLEEANELRAKLTGKPSNIKVFTQRLAKLGDRARPDVWAEHGLARKTNKGTGPWLLRPLALVDESVAPLPPHEDDVEGHVEPSSDQELSPSTDPSDADVEAEVNQLIG